MYYLKHEHEFFIRYKMRGAAERFIADKARIASVLNSVARDVPGGKRILIIKINAQHNALSKAI